MDETQAQARRGGTHAPAAAGAAGDRRAGRHGPRDRRLRDQPAALARTEHRQHPLHDPRPPAAAVEHRAGRDRRTDLRRTGPAVALPAPRARQGDRRHRAGPSQGDRLRRAVQRGQRLPALHQGHPAAAGRVPAGARRRDGAARSAEQRRRAHRDDHHRNRGQREDEVPRQRRQRAAGRSRVAAGQRAAADRSGRRPATRQLLGRRAEDARGGEHGSRHRASGARERVRRRPRVDRLLRAGKQLSPRVVLDRLSRPRAARLLPRQDRGRRSLGADAAGHPPDLHRPADAGRRSPGERDRDGAAGPAAALLGGMVGPRR